MPIQVKGFKSDIHHFERKLTFPIIRTGWTWLPNANRFILHLSRGAKCMFSFKGKQAKWKMLCVPLQASLWTAIFHQPSKLVEQDGIRVSFWWIPRANKNNLKTCDFFLFVRTSRHETTQKFTEEEPRLQLVSFFFRRCQECHSTMESRGFKTHVTHAFCWHRRHLFASDTNLTVGYICTTIHLHHHSCLVQKETIVHPRKPTWQFEDVWPVKNVDFPASHVSLLKKQTTVQEFPPWGRRWIKNNWWKLYKTNSSPEFRSLHSSPSLCRLFWNLLLLMV